MALVALAFTALLILLICRLIVTFSVKAVYFSKLTFSFFFGVVLNGNVPIAGSGWMGTLVWTAIVFGIGFLLCRVPRLDCAIQFFSTSIVSYFFTYFLFEFFNAILLKDSVDVVKIELIIKIICAAVSFKATFDNAQTKPRMNLHSNAVLLTVERILASFLYSLAILVICSVTFHNAWSFPVIVNVLIFVGAFAGAFVLDFMIFGNKQSRYRHRDIQQLGDTIEFDDPNDRYIDDDEDKWDHIMDYYDKSDDKYDAFGNKLPDEEY